MENVYYNFFRGLRPEVLAKYNKYHPEWINEKTHFTHESINLEIAPMRMIEMPKLHNVRRPISCRRVRCISATWFVREANARNYLAAILNSVGVEVTIEDEPSGVLACQPIHGHSNLSSSDVYSPNPHQFPSDHALNSLISLVKKDTFKILQTTFAYIFVRRDHSEMANCPLFDGKPSVNTKESSFH